MNYRDKIKSCNTKEDFDNLKKEVEKDLNDKLESEVILLDLEKENSNFTFILEDKSLLSKLRDQLKDNGISVISEDVMTVSNMIKNEKDRFNMLKSDADKMVEDLSIKSASYLIGIEFKYFYIKNYVANEKHLKLMKKEK